MADWNCPRFWESQKRRSPLLTGCWTPTNRVLNTKEWDVTLISFIAYTLEFEWPLSLILAVVDFFPFLQWNPKWLSILNIKMAYECSHSLTGVALFSRIPLGVQKTLLHGGRVTSCGTYGHQSGPKTIPPTASSADTLCWCSRWVRIKCLFFPLDTELTYVYILFFVLCILINILVSCKN